MVVVTKFPSFHFLVVGILLKGKAIPVKGREGP
jgi:hypothetical protein